MDSYSEKLQKSIFSYLIIILFPASMGDQPSTVLLLRVRSVFLMFPKAITFCPAMCFIPVPKM